MYEVIVNTEFSAAHRLRLYDGKFENLHGHNWTVKVTALSNDLDKIGVGVDFVLLKDRTEKILSALDYKNINEVPPFDEKNPSAENIARWLFDKLKEEFNDDRVKIQRVQVNEMPGCGAAYFE